MARDDRMPYAGITTPPRFENWQAPRQRRWMRNNAPSGLTGTPPQAAAAEPQTNSWFPAPQTPPPNFMPHMPEYEAGLRALEDAYAGNQQSLTNQMNLIGPQANQQMQRLGTDKGYAENAHREAMADRGLWDSTVNPYLRTRDIQIPYGREEQDVGQWAAQAYGDLTSALAQNSLDYNQGWNELILQNATSAAQNMPMNVPQYSEGERQIGPRRRPKKKGNK